VLSYLKVVDPLLDENKADYMHLDVKKVKPQSVPRHFPKIPGPRALPPVLVRLEHLYVCCCRSCEAKIEVVIDDDGTSEEILLLEPPASSLKLEVVVDDDDGDDDSLCFSDDSASGCEDRHELFEGRWNNNESGSDSSTNFEFPSELVFDTSEEFLRAEPPTNSLKLEVNFDDDDDNDDDSLFEFPSELAFDLSHRQ
jgi:hypothetical protein